MTDIILKHVPGTNPHTEIVGIDLRAVYKNVAVAVVEDVSSLNFDTRRATILTGGLIDYVDNFYADDNAEVFGSEEIETRKLTDEEFEKTLLIFKAILLKRVEIK